LSIENIQPPTSNDLYSCVASNEGGISKANVTLVHSPSVATYVGDGEAMISWLLTGGVASGVLIFGFLSLWILFCSVKKARRSLVTSTKRPGGNNSETCNGYLLDSEAKLQSRTASLEAMEDSSTFEEQQLRQTTAVARAQRGHFMSKSVGRGSEPAEAASVADCDVKSHQVVTSSSSTNPHPTSHLIIRDDHEDTWLPQHQIATKWVNPRFSEQQQQQFPDLLDCHQNIRMSENYSQHQPPPPPSYQRRLLAPKNYIPTNHFGLVLLNDVLKKPPFIGL
jgi:hypothetical protein